MRFIIWLVVLSISAVLVAWLMKNNSGHVVLFWNAYRVDLSLNTALILFAAFNIVAFIILRMLSGLINLPLKAKAYRVHQRSIRAFRHLAVAIEHLFAGRYIKAIKESHFPTLYPETSNIAWMIVAQANHQLKNNELRDEALLNIQEPPYQQAKLILQAQFLADDRHPTAALKVVQQLQEKGARQFLVQNIAIRANQLAKNWLEVIRIANNLKKRNYLSPLMAKARMVEGLNQLLVTKKYTSTQLLKQWEELTPADRENPALMRLFVKGFIQLQDATNTKKLLDFGFGLGVFSELVLLIPSYTRIHGVNANESILLIEKFLKQDMANPYLHFSMAELCFAKQLWGKAISSYEAVITSPQVDLDLKAQSHLRLVAIYDQTENALLSSEHQTLVMQLLATKIHYE